MARWLIVELVIASICFVFAYSHKAAVVLFSLIHGK